MDNILTWAVVILWFISLVHSIINHDIWMIILDFLIFPVGIIHGLILLVV